MNKRKELAVKVKELANKLLEWDFQITEYKGSYYVETMIDSQKEEWKIFVSLVFQDRYALLKVWTPNSRQDDIFVYDRLMELAGTNVVISKYGIFSTIFGETGLCFNVPLPFSLLESMADIIINRVMPEMIGAMAEVILHSKEND